MTKPILNLLCPILYISRTERLDIHRSYIIPAILVTLLAGCTTASKDHQLDQVRQLIHLRPILQFFQHPIAQRLLSQPWCASWILTKVGLFTLIRMQLQVCQQQADRSNQVTATCRWDWRQMGYWWQSTQISTMQPPTRLSLNGLPGMGMGTMLKSPTAGSG